MKAFVSIAEQLIIPATMALAALPSMGSAQTMSDTMEPDEMPTALKQHKISAKVRTIAFNSHSGKNGKAESDKSSGTTARKGPHFFVPESLNFLPIDSNVCARLDSAFLTFPKGNAGILPAYDKLSQILQGRNKQLNIIHIGDSHIQADIISGRIRQNLTAMAPGCCADRGILFPFRAINTNGPADYSITATGRWTKTWNLERNPARPIGISGAVATTSDANASLSVDVKQQKWAFSTLRILGNSPDDDHMPVVNVDGKEFTATTDDQPGYVFHLPTETTRCHITFRGSGSFELRGIIPTSSRPGITYSAVGINGARCTSWIQCTKFEEELALLQPDIAVVALGTNDANGRTVDIETFKNNYRNLLSKIHTVNPDCFIIFTTNNDCYIGGTRTWCPTTPLTQQAFYELAAEYGAAVFDIFAIQGGARSTDRWVGAGLQQPDHVHFSSKGYNLLGDLFYNAFLRSYKEAAK